MEVDYVIVLHLCQDVDLLLDVLHGHAPPGCLHPLLLDILCGILSPGGLFYYAMDNGKFSAEIEFFNLAVDNLFSQVIVTNSEDDKWQIEVYQYAITGLQFIFIKIPISI